MKQSLKKDQVRVLVLVATYNEAINIRSMLFQLLKLSTQIDVLVVDDNSPDGTAEIAQTIAKKQPRVKVIVRKGKRGRGLASLDVFKTFSASAYEYICENDADFQENPTDVKKLLTTAVNHDADIVLGSRYVPGGGFESKKKFVSLLASMMTHLFFQTKLHDPTCWFHIIHRRVFEVIHISKLTSTGFFLACEIHLLAEKNGCKIIEIPIFFPDRKHGESKMNIGTILYFGLDAIKFWSSQLWKKI